MSGSRNFNPQTIQDLVLPWLGCRDIAPTLLSDGATSNRRLEATPGSPGALGGMPATFWVKRFYVPTSNPSASAYIILLAAGSGGDSASNNAFVVYLTTAGILRIRQNGAAGATDYRLFDYAAFRSTYYGQWVQIVISFPTGDSTTNPIITVNGVDISALFTPSTAGAYTNWMPTTLAAANVAVGLNWPSGPVPEVEYGPGAWTAAEALTAAQTGLAPGWWQVGTGSAVANYSSDFSATADGWTGGTGLTLTSNQDGVSGEDDTLKISYSATNSLYIQKNNTALKYGAAYRRTFRYLAESGAVSGTAYWGGPNSTGASGAYLVGTQIVADGTWRTAEVVFVLFRGDTSPLLGAYAAASGTTILVGLQSGKSIWIKDVKDTPIGPIAKWDIQPGGLTLVDSGDNKIPLYLTAGMTALGPKPEHISVLSNQMTADGFVLADQVITPAGYELVAAYATRLAGSGTGTLTVKETSSGGTTVATGAIAAGTVALTVSNGLLAGGKKLHVANSGWSSTTVQLRFVFRRAT
jgi:hypothetical protein